MFSVYHPLNDKNDEMYLDGNIGPIDYLKMSKDPSRSDWMSVKYGVQMAPWRISVSMPNIETGEDGRWKQGSKKNQIYYSYELRNQKQGINIREREPERGFEIQDPQTYRGQLGALGQNVWNNTDHVFIVNGVVNKADGNFEGPFYMKSLEGTSISIGTFPKDDFDAKKIKELGCTALLDLQTHYRANPRSKVLTMFKKQKFSHIKFREVHDQIQDEYLENLFKAAAELEDLINAREQHVYVHCNTGISRAPTLVLAYFSLYCRYPAGCKTVEEMAHFIKTKYELSNPNIDIIKKLIAHNHTFIENQRKLREEEAERARTLRDQGQREKELADLRAEIERLRKQRIAEQEAEQKRLDQVNAEEAEKNRKWKEEQAQIEEDWKRKIREAQKEIDDNIARDEEAERVRQEKLAKERKQYEDELAELQR